MFINYFDDNIKLLSSIIGTIGFFSLSLLWTWMILRNYLQLFLFQKGMTSSSSYLRFGSKEPSKQTKNPLLIFLNNIIEMEMK